MTALLPRNLSERICLVISLGILLGLASPLMKPAQPSWPVWLMLWSPGVLMLLGESLAARVSETRLQPPWYLAMLAVLWAAMLCQPGLGAAVLASAWLFLRLVVAGNVMGQWLQRPEFSPPVLCLRVARLFPAIGAAWLVANRLNLMPFGFDALIVLLTAAHFHHAGFTLPLLAGLWGKAMPGRFSQISCGLILAGVPLVAAGITCTHFKALPWVEPVAVSVLVTGALGVAAGHLRMAMRPQGTMGARLLFAISGLSLAAAMLLALSFGLRSWLPQWALNMPAMWAVHGTLNTFGFGLCGILAWRAEERRQNES